MAHKSPSALTALLLHKVIWCVLMIDWRSGSIGFCSAPPRKKDKRAWIPSILFSPWRSQRWCRS
jgi:hypothetical protein